MHSDMPRLPNFLIIGAAKSATTSLAEYLTQHPDVFIPPGNKEPSYFALQGQELPPAGPVPSRVHYELWYSHCVTKFEDYTALFESAGSERAIGEASVRYLYFPDAVRHIKESIPNVRLIAILREPVARLYSHYCMNLQYQFEPLELLDAVAAESERKADKWGWDWHYVGLGLYGEQLKRYYNAFSPEQIRVFFYDDFVKSPLQVIREICRHIGVDEKFSPDMSERGMVSYRPKSGIVERLLRWPRASRPGVERFLPIGIPRTMETYVERWNRGPIPKLDSTIKRELRKYFVNDIRELEELLGVKVPWYD
jgi:hypothetical protein